MAMIRMPKLKRLFWKSLLPVIVFITGFLLYSNTLTHDYALDDYPAIVANEIVRSGYHRLPELLTKPYYYGSTQYSGDDQLFRPLTLFSYATDMALYGHHAPFMHFTNVLLYAFCILAVFILMRRLFGESPPWIALWIALFFAVHPVHVEVVANIKSRDEILSLLFGLLLTLICVFRYLDMQQKRYMILGLLSFFTGVFSKENALTVVAILPLTLFFFTSEKMKRLVLITLPFIGIAGLYLIARELSLAHYSHDKEALMHVLTQGAKLGTHWGAMAFYYMIRYLKLLFWPHPLVWDYGFNQIPHQTFQSPWVVLSIALHLILLGLALFQLKKKSLFSYVILFYFAALSVYVHVTVRTGASMAERFLFMPSLAFCMLLGWGIVTLFRTLKSQELRNAFVCITLLMLLACAAKTVKQNIVWKNTLTVSQAAVHVHPHSWKSHSSLAGAYLERIKVEPDFDQRQQIWLNIVNACKAMVRIHPQDAGTYYNLGGIYCQLGAYEQAENAFDRHLALAKPDRQVFQNIAKLFLARKKYLLSIKYYTAYLLNVPGDAEILTRLGVIYLQCTDERQKAKHCLVRALEIKPELADAHEHLGHLYWGEGNQEKAKQCFHKAVQLDPSRANRLNPF